MIEEKAPVQPKGMSVFLTFRQLVGIVGIKD
jgi:hypothetical protein